MPRRLASTGIRACVPSPRATYVVHVLETHTEFPKLLGFKVRGACKKHARNRFPEMANFDFFWSTESTADFSVQIRPCRPAGEENLTADRVL